MVLAYNIAVILVLGLIAMLVWNHAFVYFAPQVFDKMGYINATCAMTVLYVVEIMVKRYQIRRNTYITDRECRLKQIELEHKFNMKQLEHEEILLRESIRLEERRMKAIEEGMDI